MSGWCQILMKKIEPKDEEEQTNRNNNCFVLTPTGVHGVTSRTSWPVL